MPKIQFKKLSENALKKAEFKMPRLKFKKETVINKRIHAFRVVMGSVIILSVLFIGALIDNVLPYALSVESEELCYLNKKDADKLTETIAEDYIPEGATLKAMTSDGAISIEKCFKVVTKKDRVSGKKAKRLLEEALISKANSDIEITAISTITTLEDYTPEPELVKDEKMLAGEEKVKKKGTDGTQNVTRTYITVNRAIKSVEISNTEIVKEGTPTIIKRGTLGLPEGADWRTFDGEPEFHDGEAVVTTALNYLGSPYKYGGKSLETGIDCVWFVVKMYEKYGVELPANHPGLKSAGVGVSIENAKKGDIVCYSKHVCIYMGDGKIVEANSKHGVSVGKLNKSRVVTIRRIVEQ